MSQSLVRIAMHLVFSTKHRAPLIDHPVRDELHRYLAGILDNWECKTVEVGGVDDHVHLLFLGSKNHAPKKIIEEVKKSSSKWIKTKGAAYARFYWQAGYGLFSVSESNIEKVRRYIQNQEEHHNRQSFQDEFRELLRKHNVEFDERYLWD